MSKHFVSDKNESPRLFKNDMMEALSKVHFTIPLFIFVPVIGYSLYLSIADDSLAIYEIIGLIVLGGLTWTLTEYVMHRFVFHYHATSQFGKNLMFLIHGVHHDYPNDEQRLVLPPALSIPLATMFYFFFDTLLGTYLPPFFAGFIAGYLFYDMGHYALHHFKLKGKYWGVIKDNHMRHHYKEPENGFGVSSTVWDVVFFTRFKNKATQKMEREESKMHAMRQVSKAN